MRCLTVLALLAGAAAPAQAQNKQHPFALGIELGDPAGFTAKYWRSNDQALQFGFGLRARNRYDYWDYYGDDYAPLLTADYVTHFADFGPRNRRVSFRMGLGFGGGLGYLDGCYREWWGQAYCPDSGSMPTALVRMPISFNAYVARARIELFGQLAPGVRFFPTFLPISMASAGARFYF